MIPTATLLKSRPIGKLWDWVRSRPTTFVLGSGISLGVGSLIWFTIWMATPRNIDVIVHDISWMHITNLRQRETRHNAEWYHQATKGFYQEPVFNQTCEQRYHYTDTYVCGSYQVSCGSNCSSTVYVYCSRDVYDSWCKYDYYEWPVIDTKQLIGSGHDVEWGEYRPDGPTQRVQKIASYEVNFESEERDEFQYRPSTLEDYRRFTTGDRWRLTVGRIRRHNIEKMTQLP